MPQLHFYVPREIAERIQHEAQMANKSVSGYLADLVRRELAPGWSEEFFDEVVGGWRGEALQRLPQGEYEQRIPLEPRQ